MLWIFVRKKSLDEFHQEIGQSHLSLVVLGLGNPQPHIPGWQSEDELIKVLGLDIQKNLGPVQWKHDKPGNHGIDICLVNGVCVDDAAILFVVMPMILFG